MVNAVILIKAERTQINEAAQKLADIDGISEVYSVSGKYDLIAIVRVKSNDELSQLVTDRLREVPGLLKTETMLAFQAYSRHDLEAMFSV